MKRSKTNYYNSYFDINWNNIKNTWKGIKPIFSIKPNPSDIPKILSPTDKHEVPLIVSSLDSTKSVGPNSIPTKILKLLKNYISCQLADIFNMLFFRGVFPSALKIAKVVPVHEKESKQDFSIYRPISLLSILDKILEKIMFTEIFKFFNNNNLFYLLQFGFRQNYSTTNVLINLTETIRKYIDEGKFEENLKTYKKLLTWLSTIFY